MSALPVGRKSRTDWLQNPEKPAPDFGKAKFNHSEGEQKTVFHAVKYSVHGVKYSVHAVKYSVHAVNYRLQFGFPKIKVEQKELSA